MPIENENFKGEVLLLYRPTEGLGSQGSQGGFGQVCGFVLGFFCPRVLKLVADLIFTALGMFWWGAGLRF